MPTQEDWTSAAESKKPAPEAQVDEAHHQPEKAPQIDVAKAVAEFKLRDQIRTSLDAFKDTARKAVRVSNEELDLLTDTLGVSAAEVPPKTRSRKQKACYQVLVVLWKTHYDETSELWSGSTSELIDKYFGDE